MATNPTRVTDGTLGSASQVQEAFTELRTQGQQAIDSLIVLRENTLLLFNNSLSELNGKRVRANRLAQVGIAAKFLTSDLQDINQPITTATLRCDANNAVLRERQAPGEAIVSQVRFSASQGTIQVLQVPQTGATGNLGALYRVATQNGAIPVGTFDIQLLDKITTSLIIFDIMDMPAGPSIQPFISQNGINFTPATNVTQNGYRLAAWFIPAEIQYIRITITPAIPDILGGSVFTFGLTDFHAFSVRYHLQADVYTNQIEMFPQTEAVRFVTETVPGLTYFLSLGGNPSIEVFPGQVIPLPGTTAVSAPGITLTNPPVVPWAASTSYLLGNTISDSNGNLQTVTTAGISGILQPSTVAPLSGVLDAVGGNTTYNGIFATPFPAGFPVTISGFDLSVNNGTFTIVSSTGLQLIVNNPNGVVDTFTGTAIFDPWSVDGTTTSDGTVVWTETASALLNYTLLSNIYLPSLLIVDHATGIPIRTAPGLPSTALGMSNQYITINSGILALVLYNSANDASRTFDISYVTGPPTITAQLHTQLATNDLNNTPVYSGAQLAAA